MLPPTVASTRTEPNPRRSPSSVGPGCRRPAPRAGSRRTSRPWPPTPTARPGTGHPCPQPAPSRRAHRFGVQNGGMTAISSAPSTRRSRAAVALLAAALVLTVLTRPQVLVGVALLGLVLVPLERAVPLKRQRVLRPGLVTDLTHLLAQHRARGSGDRGARGGRRAPARCRCAASTSRPPSPAPCRRRSRPSSCSLGSYWGHRLTHQVPFLWRFHAVHHSIEHMDWLAAGRLHPLDAGVHPGVPVLPLFALGYDAGLVRGRRRRW